jgi:WD40 repeat protein
MGHKRGINCLAFSADGTLLASAGLDQQVRIWDVKTRRERQQPLPHKGMVFGVAFFHHSQAVVTGGDDGLARIWDLSTSKERFVLRGHTAKQIETVAVSPDDKVVATGSWDAAVKLWDPQTGKETATLRHEEGWVLSLAFSPDGHLLASAGSDGRVYFWDMASRTLLKNPRQHGWFARAVDFSPDGKLLASGGEDKTARLWDVAAGEDVATLSAIGATPSPDAPIATGATPLADAPEEGKLEHGSKGWRGGIVLGLLASAVAVVVAWLLIRRWLGVRASPAGVAADAASPTISLQCGACSRKLRVRAELAGKKVKCPNCGQGVRIPGPAVPDC